MTEILLLNIKEKDKLYVSMLKAKPNSVEKFEIKAKLKQKEADIEEWILEAKKVYFDSQFTEHMKDVKKTWDTIRTAINRRKPNSAYPENFVVNGESISDKKKISDAFNKFFTSIGPDLANRLDSSGKPSFSSYLGPRKQTNFNFRPTTNKEVGEIIKKFVE